VGRPDAAQDRDLGVGEVGGDGVAEVADRPAGVGGGELVQVLGRARLGQLDDPAADLEVAVGLVGVVAQQGDPRVMAHVALFGEAAHGVDPQALAVDVAPHHRGLRMPLGGDGGQGGHRWALGQVAVGRRDLVGRMIVAQADGWHRSHLPGGAPRWRGCWSWIVVAMTPSSGPRVGAPLQISKWASRPSR
jgi:hypothetical protein